MTLDLDPIRAHAEKGHGHIAHTLAAQSARELADDVDTLVAEVERLRDALERIRRYNTTSTGRARNSAIDGAIEATLR